MRSARTMPVILAYVCYSAAPGPSMPTSPTQPRRHPPGLYVLFFTELWERYSFYSMMAILTLYMDEALHFDTARIGAVYGGYIGGVYLMPLARGLLAGRGAGFYCARGLRRALL